MHRISVDTSTLRGTGASIAEIGDQLAPLSQALDRVQSAGAAADCPSFTTALAGMADAWGRSLLVVGIGVAALGSATTTAAAAYDVTDQNAVPTTK